MTLTKVQELKAFLQLNSNITKANAKYIVKELLSEQNNWHLAGQWQDYFLDQIYDAMGNAYACMDKWDDAIAYYQKGIDAAETNWPEYGYANKQLLYHNIAIAYCNKGLKKEALDAYRKAVYNELKMMSNVSYPTFDFFTFRNSKEFAIADLRESKISFSSLFDFNDPVDSAYFTCSNYYISEISDSAEKMFCEIRYDVYSELRAKCFITSKHLPSNNAHRPSSLDIAPYLNTIMWSHYANYHNGYCAMYNFPTDMTQVKDSEGYCLLTAEINYIDELQYPNSLDFKTGFLTKSRRWEYEHEKRILFYQKSGDTKPHPEVKIPKDALKAVYIGLKCDKEYEIYEALADKPDVKVFKMQISNDDIYSLEAKEIDRSTWHPVKPIIEKKKDQCAVKRVWNCLKKSIKNDCKELE